MITVFRKSNRFDFGRNFIWCCQFAFLQNICDYANNNNNNKHIENKIESLVKTIGKEKVENEVGNIKRNNLFTVFKTPMSSVFILGTFIKNIKNGSLSSCLKLLVNDAFNKTSASGILILHYFKF